MRSALPALVALVAAVSPVQSAAVTPIQKVLQLMEDMKAKAIKEKDDEATRFSAFSQWCKNTVDAKTKAIQAASDSIEKSEADIEKAQEDIETATARIAELEEDLGRWKRDGAAASDVRKKEAADFRVTRRDLADVVDACERAAAVLKELPDKVPQALLQLASMKSVPDRERKQLTAFAQQPEGAWNPNPMLFKETGTPHAYESHSNPVINMLMELRSKFQKQLTDLEKEEMIAKHAYQQVMQKLADQTELAEQELGQQKKLSAERKADKAEAEGEKAEAEQDKAEGEKYLGETNSLCELKSADFASRQQLRGEEIEALAKAIEIIGGENVAAERLPGGAAAAAGASLAQMLRRASPADGDVLKKVAALLQSRATATGSRTLAMAAQKAMSDPFAKVKRMIRDMITRLLEESAGEADHKAWCDAELATNKQTRTIKAEAVDDLAAKADGLKAEKVQLSQEIADLSAEIKSLNDAVVKATAERAEEKAKNEETIKDAQMSQTAVAQALAVLREFYAKAATATALTQQTPGEDAPVTFDSPYQGMQAESGGVVGMLEVIESDFTRLEATTTTSEQEAVSSFKKFKAASEQDAAVAQTEVDHKNSKLETAGQMLLSTQKSLEETQAELDAAMAYYEKLKPSCVDAGLSYDERVKRREEEIQTLKEAYKILSGEDVPSFQAMKAEQIGTD